MKHKHPRGRVGRLFAILAGTVLTLNGMQYLSLLAFGAPARAHIEYAVSASGARNPVYRVHYEFDAGGGTRQGVATLGASARPSGFLSARYLPFWPGINYYDSPGLLAAYGLLSLLPGTALIVTALRRN